MFVLGNRKTHLKQKNKNVLLVSVTAKSVSSLFFIIVTVIFYEESRWFRTQPLQIKFEFCFGDEKVK